MDSMLHNLFFRLYLIKRFCQVALAVPMKLRWAFSWAPRRLLARDMKGKAIWARHQKGSKSKVFASSVMLMDNARLTHWQFARDVALGTAPGAQPPTGSARKVELVVNGNVVAAKDVPADDQVHDLTFDVNIEQSSWVALRHFPQMHTNPVTVIVADKPVRASKASAKWCVGTIEQLWKVRGAGIKEDERAEAERTFKRAIEIYKKIAAEASDR